ncbi:DUF6274 family protein [Streptomyces sp. NPDC005423]|uniref:DUF6274 family protein n=1 Tax=Streptomyces sp. NPDC005423 TaxID=3155343 RepID=UPI0033ACBADD
MAATVRHETGALLRAHLSAASSYPYRHLTRHCAVCHRLLRLAMGSGPRTPQQGPQPVEEGAHEESPAGA